MSLKVIENDAVR